MLKNLAKKLTNNLGLKVLAVLFAIALWIEIGRASCRERV